MAHQLNVRIPKVVETHLELLQICSDSELDAEMPGHMGLDRVLIGT